MENPHRHIAAGWPDVTDCRLSYAICPMALRRTGHCWRRRHFSRECSPNRPKGICLFVVAAAPYVASNTAEGRHPVFRLSKH